VRALTTVSCATCPRWYTQQAFVQQAARAHYYIEKGSVAVIAGELSPQLLEAVDLIRAGLSRAVAHMSKRKQAEDDGLG